MKLLISLLFYLVLMAGCASTESTVNEKENESKSSSSQVELQQVRPDDAIHDQYDNHQNLADYLKRIPGVNVTGNTVIIRGINSFNSDIEPLYVIDGQAVGTNYSQVNNMLNPRDIDYVKALKGTDAAIYGVRGGNGVIVIVTKK